MKSVIQMTMNSCRDRANFTEQMITEGAVLYTKNNKSPVLMVICSRFHLRKNEV